MWLPQCQGIIAPSEDILHFLFLKYHIERITNVDKGGYKSDLHMFHVFREKDAGPRKTHSKAASNTYHFLFEVFLLTDHSYVKEV